MRRNFKSPTEVKLLFYEKNFPVGQEVLITGRVHSTMRTKRVKLIIFIVDEEGTTMRLEMKDEGNFKVDLGDKIWAKGTVQFDYIFPYITVSNIQSNKY